MVSKDGAAGYREIGAAFLFLASPAERAIGTPSLVRAHASALGADGIALRLRPTHHPKNPLRLGITHPHHLNEAQALSFIRGRVRKGTTINADEAPSWNDLHGRFEMLRINHEQAYSLNGACTNNAESFFSRMRRAEIGHHHHIAGPYLLRFAQEAAWREDNRRLANGEQVQAVSALAMRCKPSVDFCGYWQRSARS